jgi:hypothetical protein
VQQDTDERNFVSVRSVRASESCRVVYQIARWYVRLAKFEESCGSSYMPLGQSSAHLRLALITNSTAGQVVVRPGPSENNSPGRVGHKRLSP